jgi:hypothetical protein
MRAGYCKSKNAPVAANQNHLIFLIDADPIFGWQWVAYFRARASGFLGPCDK